MTPLLSILKWGISYSLMLLLTACLQQEIRPTPDKNTRGCLIKQKDDYTGYGNNWELKSQVFEYNTDGNPVRRTFIDIKRKVTEIHTMEYEGLRLKRINQYKGDTENPANLTAYKTIAISADFRVMIEHTFQRRDASSFQETLTRVLEFFRNDKGDLKLSLNELVTSEATPEKIGQRLGWYWRLEYDTKNENVARRTYRLPPDTTVQVQYTLGGFDLNGRSPWNVNFWLSYLRDLDNDFITGDGYWSENNVALLAPGGNKTLFFIIYELNGAGFPCVSYSERADRVPDSFKSFYYYYNCDCQR